MSFVIIELQRPLYINLTGKKTVDPAEIFCRIKIFEANKWTDTGWYTKLTYSIHLAKGQVWNTWRTQIVQNNARI